MRKCLIVCALLFSSGTHAAEPLPPSYPIGASQVFLKTLPYVVRNLPQFALGYAGVSYRRGGASPERGFDCSGFVRYIFDHADGVMLPHSANAISRLGNRIRMTELLPGDLVFFHIMRNTVSHVGIYLGNDQFIHASSTQAGSVMVSNLNDHYWTKHFSLARRIDVHTEQISSLSEDSSPPFSLRLESSLRSVSNN